jgi:hypothetical protein
MLPLRWSTTAAAIGAIIATGAGATMIAIGRNTKTKAIVDGKRANSAPASRETPLLL